MSVPFSTSALMLMVRSRSSSFSYSIPLDPFRSNVRFGLSVASRRRDRNIDDVPAGGAIPPPSKPNTTSANLTLLPGGGQIALLLEHVKQCYYYKILNKILCSTINSIVQSVSLKYNATMSDGYECDAGSKTLTRRSLTDSFSKEINYKSCDVCFRIF